MNGQEKSDPAIVAERPTNEAGRPAEEPEEPRAGAEGNANQQSAFRTQRRVDASQALERIRPAARLRRPSPEVGAVCGNPARTVLCGGRSAMSVPTAILLGFIRPNRDFSMGYGESKQKIPALSQVMFQTSQWHSLLHSPRRRARRRLDPG